ncbi:MAG: nucleoside triphosphate pyrophosphatase [Actinomycetota bacterium]|jgi:septum formation protein|nr:nucleoside triphosphate pyrophosphatase [Actinomycetota bacterium]
MPATHLVLASASETRLRVLRSAGLDPEVAVSDVDETVGEVAPSEIVAVLAERKVNAVAGRFADALVLGCDSMVELDGRILGKPASGDEAVAWWRAMRGRTATVWTGHFLMDTATGETASWTADARVRFGSPSDAEIERYVASGEATGAAGGFRLEGRAAAFIESVDGDPGTVHGISLPALRLLLAELGVQIADLWVR